MTKKKFFMIEICYDLERSCGSASVKPLLAIWLIDLWLIYN